MKILNSIGLKYKTDKSSFHHDYLRKYEKYLSFSRDENLKILEIGVLEAKSLYTWMEYFYNSEILGIDINPECKKYEKDKIKIEIGSQDDPEFLKKITENYGPFDLIIDDGSHINKHMIFTFENLFSSLESQGVYIIEDVCCSYWQNYGGSLNNPNSVIEYFKKKVDEVNFFGEYLNSDRYCMRNDLLLLEQFKNKKQNCLGFEIESLNFLNSLIIINKR